MKVLIAKIIAKLFAPKGDELGGFDAAGKVQF